MNSAELEIIILDLKKVVVETEAIAKEANKNLEESRLVLSMMQYELDKKFGGEVLA